MVDGRNGVSAGPELGPLPSREEEMMQGRKLLAGAGLVTLVVAMAKQGFVNYRLEWWHFSLPGPGNTAYDFPVAKR